MKLGGLPFGLLPLQPEHVTAVAGMFEEINADPTARRFHPHPFDADNAIRVCSGAGRDLYSGLWIDGKLSGYGMLRGWDEGFDTPSLGIWISARLRGTGAAKAMMSFLHLAASLSGAVRIRLKVYSDNEKAIALYRSFGYRFSEVLEPDGQLLGVLDLGFTQPAAAP